MKSMTSNELRQKFLDYFHAKNHEIVSSSPLVPENDPTLLFTNAGMVQFKDVFLGKDKRDYKRAVTSQRCLRAGGKHNDLENVGYTARHHTFFEMLGNFSFGDYFKEEAILHAWDFLTNVLELPEERLWVTVFRDDDEAADIWLNKINVDPSRFSRMGEKDNFWSMADTGPCGPCSEIFYDHGPQVEGGPPGSKNEDGDRYIEIWNLVFMQYDRSEDGSMTPLPKPSVDTGMGLERLAAVMQSVHSNYEIDLFDNLIKATADRLKLDISESSSLNVVVDHIRACSFLIIDGVLPGNEGRNYVLRRIMRRAIRHGKKLDIHEPFFYKLLEPLAEQMGQAYPELIEQKNHIEDVIKQEEIRFSVTLDQGMEILEEAILSMENDVLPGEVVFKLYDTYGFPVDLTNDIARERNFSIDLKGFDEHMNSQKIRARKANKFSGAEEKNYELTVNSEFFGYEFTEKTAKIKEIFVDGNALKSIEVGQEGFIVTDATPFYAESGGQVGDTGIIHSKDGVFKVTDTQKQNNSILHHGILEKGKIDINKKVTLTVDDKKRLKIAANHSATHLMHAALRNTLGKHVKQKGSLVDATRLRFDFSHNQPLTETELSEIEAQVNAEIRKNNAAKIDIMAYQDAIDSGAMALFGEKYEDQVRVLNFGEYSIELCGGTHVNRTGDIGLFKIVSETGVASGIRRIEALTGEAAQEWLTDYKTRLDRVAVILKSSEDQVDSKVEQLLLKNKELEKELSRSKQRMFSGNNDDISSNVTEINGKNILVQRLDGFNADDLRTSIDRYKDKLKSAIVVLGASEKGKAKIAVGVTKDNTELVHAGELIKKIAEVVGGKGGGRPDFAQAGGPEAKKLDEALKLAKELINSKI